MKKGHQVFAIISIIVFVVLVAVGVFFIDGTKLRNSHYIRLEINPKIEFLTDADNIVNTVYPVNAECYDMIINEEFVGLKIEDAVEKFLDLSAKMGYLDVDSKDNGVQISVSSSFTQAFESKIYKACNNYFSENEIYSVIAESDADLALFNEAKEKKVKNIEKLVMIKSIMEKTDKYSFEELNKMSLSDLIDVLEKLHEEYQENLKNYTSENLANKEKLLSDNKPKYENHLSKITEETKRNFSEKYIKFKKSETYDYELDFAKKYAEKKENM